MSDKYQKCKECAVSQSLGLYKDYCAQQKKKKEEISECYKHLNSLILPSPEVPLSPEEIKSRFFVVVQEQYVKVQKKR